jgi:Fur family transcriptional regulator, ferric uptake regulator
MARRSALATVAPKLSSRQEQLLEALRRAGRELSGQDLHASLRASATPMGLATVYRHLRQLQQWGRVRCRHLPSGEALFAPTERDEHHLTCVDCGRTHRLDRCPVHALELSGAELQGYRPLFHTLEFYGLCPDCQRRQQHSDLEGREAAGQADRPASA